MDQTSMTENDPAEKGGSTMTQQEKIHAAIHPAVAGGQVMTSSVKNRRHEEVDPATDVIVHRPSKWGNPFPISPTQNRLTVIEKYRQHLLASPHLLKDIGELKGKNLVCWCAPAPCHADILLELANK
jgi:hypothetical protein